MNDNLSHTPVLVGQAVEYLAINPSGIYVDCTLGGGGHSYEILSHLNQDGKLIGIDWDEQAVGIANKKLLSSGKRYSIVNDNFAHIKDILAAENIKYVNGFLLDLGISSFQIDVPERGFSYLAEGPLDMRMSLACKRSAAALLNTESESQLAWLFYNYGEEKRSRIIAKAIVKKRQHGIIKTTKQLTEVIESVTPYRKRIKTLARCFQAIRIATNLEMDNLQIFLNKVTDLLVVGGRLVTISFHSMEDRLIKNIMYKQTNPCECSSELPHCICGKKPKMKILTKRIVKPTADEIRANPRCRSSKLRAYERIEN